MWTPWHYKTSNLDEDFIGFSFRGSGNTGARVHCGVIRLDDRHEFGRQRVPWKSFHPCKPSLQAPRPQASTPSVYDVITLKPVTRAGKLANIVGCWTLIKFTIVWGKLGSRNLKTKDCSCYRRTQFLYN